MTTSRFHDNPIGQWIAAAAFRVVQSSLCRLTARSFHARRAIDLTHAEAIEPSPTSTACSDYSVNADQIDIYPVRLSK